MKKTIAILVILLSSYQTFAQLSLSYYPLNSYIGVSTNPNARVWGDFRMLTNTFISNTNMELIPMINLKKDSIVKLYVGVGVNFNLIYGMYNNGKYINGYLTTIGIRVSPFHQCRNVSFIAECSPYLNSEFTGANIRSSIGLAWVFNKRKK